MNVGTLADVTGPTLEPKLRQAFETVEFRMAAACWFKHRGKKHPACPKGLFNVSGYHMLRPNGSVEVDFIVTGYGVIRDELIRDVVKRVEAVQGRPDPYQLDMLAQRKVEEEMDDQTQPADELDLKQCDSWFQYHPPVGNQAARHEEVKRSAGQFARHIIALAPPGPDRTAALRKVREAMMTASAAIACGEVGTDGVRPFTIAPNEGP